MRKLHSFSAAVGIVFAVVLCPSAAPASSTLYGLLSPDGIGSDIFGSINPATGTFTQIGSGSLTNGYYAPVYDPTQNVFYVTAHPIATGDGAMTALDRIDPATGAITQINVPIGSVPLSVMGLGVATATPVPEPGSAVQFLTYLLGIAVVVRKVRSRFGVAAYGAPSATPKRAAQSNNPDRR